MFKTCLYCVEEIKDEETCQLIGQRFCHTTCFKTSRERREKRTLEEEESSATEEGECETSSATESEKEDKISTSNKARGQVITLWDDSDASDIDSSATNNAPTKFNGNPAAGDYGDKPQKTLYRSISFESDSSGNSVRPRIDPQGSGKDKKKRSANTNTQNGSNHWSNSAGVPDKKKNSARERKKTRSKSIDKGTTNNRFWPTTPSLPPQANNQSENELACRWCGIHLRTAKQVCNLCGDHRKGRQLCFCCRQVTGSVCVHFFHIGLFVFVFVFWWRERALLECLILITLLLLVYR